MPFCPGHHDTLFTSYVMPTIQTMPPNVPPTKQSAGKQLHLMNTRHVHGVWCMVYGAWCVESHTHACLCHFSTTISPTQYRPHAFGTTQPSLGTLGQRVYHAVRRTSVCASGNEASTVKEGSSGDEVESFLVC